MHIRFLATYIPHDELANTAERFPDTDFGCALDLQVLTAVGPSSLTFYIQNTLPLIEVILLQTHQRICGKRPTKDGSTLSSLGVDRVCVCIRIPHFVTRICRVSIAANNIDLSNSYTKTFFHIHTDFPYPKLCDASDEIINLPRFLIKRLCHIACAATNAAREYIL